MMPVHAGALKGADPFNAIRLTKRDTHGGIRAHLAP
jgi:hypothetical protein